MAQTGIIQAAAAAIVRLWAKTDVILEADAEAYQYGLELLLSTILNIAVMLGLSIAFGHVWLFIPYIVAFIPLRIFAGGYHAKHHLSCIFLNAIVYLGCLIAINMLSTPVMILACIIESCFSFAMIFQFAPVPAKNKPLSVKEYKRNRYVSLTLSSLFLVLCMLFYSTHVLAFRWCRMLYCGQATATILLILGKITTAANR